MGFHIFKRDLKNYSSFSNEIRNLLLLSQVDCLLSSYDSSLELQVAKQDDAIIISPCLVKVEPSYETIAEETEQEIVCDAEFVEEYIEDIYNCPEISSIIAVETQDVTVENDEAFSQEQEEIVKTKRPKTRKYKYPTNTNDKLTNEQKAWINCKVRSSEVLRDGQVAYKCPICETILRIPGSLKKHLRDNHILKPKTAQITLNNRIEFKNEIQQSMLTVETSYGPETVWKCQRCDNRVFRSEAGLKVHIRYGHIRSQQISAKFISRCKVQFEDEHGMKDGWKCPECSKILRSRDAIRNHIKLEHQELADESSNSEIVTLEILPNSDGNLGLLKDSNDYEVLQNLLERKRRTLKSDSNGNFCDDCGIKFINGTSKKEKSFRIHRECHKILNVVSLYYQFPKCEVSKTMFVNNDDLEKFLQCDQLHFEPLPYEGMTSQVSEKMKEATGSASFDDPDAWKCGHCGVRYQTEFECITHVMILHSRKLICPIDHMEFEGSRGISQFNIHMSNKHSEMFPDLVIFCTYCRMEFDSVFAKLAHMELCSAKKFECDHCAKKFFAKTQLIRHLKIISGEISYICDVCSKACASSMDLKLHRTCHTNERMYGCSYPDCNKAFKTPAARSSHMETHGNTKYDCSFCTSSFRQRALLQRHIRKGFCKGAEKGNSSKNFFEVEEMYEDDGQIFEVSEVLH